MYSVPGAEQPDRGSNPAVRCHSTTQPSPMTIWTGNLALLLPRLRGTELSITECSVSHTIKRAAITPYIQPAHLLQCFIMPLPHTKGSCSHKHSWPHFGHKLHVRPSDRHYNIPDSAQRLNWASNGVVAQKLHENSATIKKIRNHTNCWISHQKWRTVSLTQATLNLKAHHSRTAIPYSSLL